MNDAEFRDKIVIALVPVTKQCTVPEVFDMAQEFVDHRNKLEKEKAMLVRKRVGEMQAKHDKKYFNRPHKLLSD